MLSLGPTPGLWICSCSLDMPRGHISAWVAHSVWEALFILANSRPSFKAPRSITSCPGKPFPPFSSDHSRHGPQQVPMVECTQVPPSPGRDQVSLTLGPLHPTLNLGHERPGIGAKIASRGPLTLRHCANSLASVVSQACRSAEITVIMVRSAPNVY